MSLSRAIFGFGASVLVAVVLGCEAQLPEPESEDAKLYVRYCSGSGCHGAIPPQRDSYQYWEIQYDRMIEIMQRQGWELPSPQETQQMLGYLKRHARVSGS